MTDPLKAYDVQQPDFDSSIGVNLFITLDGQKCRNVRAFNAVEGWIICAVLDDNGHFVFEGDSFKEQKLYGNVKVRYKDVPA